MMAVNQRRLSLFLTYATGLTLILCTSSLSHAAVLNVSTTTQLQSALDTAVAGDEIVVADGIYIGEFDIDRNAGTPNNPITVRAANPHGAILQGTGANSRTENAFLVSKPWWIIRDFEIRNYGGPISLTANARNVEIHDNIIHSFLTDGILSDRASHGRIHNNVLAFGDFCCGGQAGIRLFVSHFFEVTDNIILGMTNGGYQFGRFDGKVGYSILIEGGDNLIKGNVIIGGGKGVLRIWGWADQDPADRNIIRDNAFLWGEGGAAGSSTCNDDSNEFINNIAYGNYDSAFSTKGNMGGNKGHHKFLHNLQFMTPFTRSGSNTAWGGGDGLCDGSKIDLIFKDNVFYSDRDLFRNTGDHFLLYIRDFNYNIQELDYNMYWGPSAESTWVVGNKTPFVHGANDIHAAGSRPVFADPANGDFSLAAGSPGKGAASDAKDIGIEYNDFLKKSWLKKAFNLETQQKNGLGTSTSFTVSPNHWYQMWFYVPTSPCNRSPETFTIEGKQVQRDIAGLVADGAEWLAPTGPARWITLGRRKATDGTMNVSWTTSSCAEKLFIRKLPNPDEAYDWIAQHKLGPTGDTTPPSPPTGLALIP